MSSIPNHPITIPPPPSVTANLVSRFALSALEPLCLSCGVPALPDSDLCWECTLDTPSSEKMPIAPRV